MFESRGTYYYQSNSAMCISFFPQNCSRSSSADYCLREKQCEAHHRLRTTSCHGFLRERGASPKSHPRSGPQLKQAATHGRVTGCREGNLCTDQRHWSDFPSSSMTSCWNLCAKLLHSMSCWDLFVPAPWSPPSKFSQLCKGADGQTHRLAWEGASNQ